MIEFQDVTAAQSGSLVLTGITLAVPSGTTLAVIGPTAAGKTSLLEVAAGVLPLARGDVRIGGCSLRQEPTRALRSVGYAPAAMAAWPTIRVDEFLRLFTTAAGLRPRVAEERIDAVLTALTLDRLAGIRLDSLSDGQTKRLLLARSLLMEPELLLLDDPFRSLDPAGRRFVEQRLSDARLLGRTVLATVNDADISDGFSHLAVLVEGRIVTQGRAAADAFPEVPRWRCRVASPAGATAVAMAIGDLVLDCEAENDTDVLCTIAGDRTPGMLAAAAGLPLERCTYDPPWSVQLLTWWTERPPP